MLLCNKSKALRNSKHKNLLHIHIFKSKYAYSNLHGIRLSGFPKMQAEFGFVRVPLSADVKYFMF